MPIINTSEVRFDSELATRIQALPPALRDVANQEMDKLAEVVSKAVIEQITLLDLFFAMAKAIVTVAEHTHQSH